VSVSVVTAAARPDLAERADELTTVAIPEFLKHGDTTTKWWDSLYELHGDLQFVLYDEESDDVLGEGNTIHCSWDGTVSGLPGGVDDVLEQAFTRELEPNTLCALYVHVIDAHQGRGLSRAALHAMGRFAVERGLENLIVPARPTWKARYPLVPMERYAHWTRADGLPFDPWIRTHVRLGAELLAVAPESLRITGTVAEWESWTGMSFPESGDYVIPRGQVLLRIDRETDVGVYVEPDVWLRHPLPEAS
jgi:GNAT superfamily N-acetyltransferase